MLIMRSFRVVAKSIYPMQPDQCTTRELYDTRQVSRGSVRCRMESQRREKSYALGIQFGSHADITLEALQRLW